MGWNETLTTINEKEEFSLSLYLYVFRGRVVHNKLAVVPVCVTDPQLRDGYIQGVTAGVSTDTGAVFVSTVERGELGLGVHEKHFATLQPAALQVDTKGRFFPLLNHTGKNHRFTLMPLQELYVTEYLIETKTVVLQTALQVVKNQ